MGSTTAGPAIIRRPPIASAQQGLDLLAPILHRDVLRELAEQGPLTRQALTARLYTRPTKLFECLKDLRAAELITVSRRAKAPEYAITDSGRHLHEGSAIVMRWFRAHPGRPLDPSVGWRAFAELGDAWRMVLIEWIVRRAPTDEDVAEGLFGYDQRQLTELLESLKTSGVVDQRKGKDGQTHHRLSNWAARAIGILAFLARWEQRFRPPGAAEIEVDDAIVAILATLPLIRLSDDAAGICTLTAELDEGQESERRKGTIWVRIRQGRAVALGEGKAPESPDGWVSGPFNAWLSAALDGRGNGMRFDGRDDAAIGLARSIVTEFHRELALYGE